jgi:dTDP-4-amino-4,6-dideoxygalactose transaminase
MITTPYRAPNNRHVFHQYTLLLNAVEDAAAYRNGLHAWLTEQGVPSMIYYPVPAHRQKMFDAFGGSSYHLPVTDRLTERVISLPIHTELDEEQIGFITATVLAFVNRK